MDGNGNLLDTTSGSTGIRSQCRQNVLNAFAALSGEIDANTSWLWWLVPPGALVYSAANLIEEQKYLGKLQSQSRSLIYWLQAYDLLKAGWGLPINDGDRNGGQCISTNCGNRLAGQRVASDRRE
jgi:hypothetical protein